MTPIPAFVTSFLQTFTQHGYEIYIVGGSVRDLLLNKEVKNWDFTTNARPEQIQELFPHSFYNNSFGTVGIPIEDPTEDEEEPMVFEVTTYRRESTYANRRHPELVEWAENIEEDLARRDFTINAMAYDGTTLHDPFGGRKDLENKLIQAVGDPNVRFQEDALRLMRAVRFTAQLGFTIQEETRTSIERNAHTIVHISAERIREELLRTIASDHPAEGVLFLRNTTLLKHILREVDVCFSIPQKSPKRHHIYDVGTHLVMSLKHCPSPDPITRFATLIHDIGKASTYRKDPKTQIITFYNHEIVGAKQAKHITQRLKFSKKDQEKVLRLVRYHQFTVSEIITDKAVRRFIREVGKEYLQDMFDLRTGDRIGSGANKTSWRFELFKKRVKEVQHEPFKVTDLKISGHDVMEILGIPAGPQIGTVLEKIFAEVEEGALKNERNLLLDRLKSETSPPKKTVYSSA